MNTASTKICIQLYRLSGWKDTTYYHQRVEYADGSTGYVLHNPILQEPLHITAYPAYDVGYLLRRLPLQVTLKKEYEASPEKPEETPAHYRALYDTADSKHFWLGADTPEDALCKLAIELFKQGILK